MSFTKIAIIGVIVYLIWSHLKQSQSTAQSALQGGNTTGAGKGDSFQSLLGAAEDVFKRGMDFFDQTVDTRGRTAADNMSY